MAESKRRLFPDDVSPEEMKPMVKAWNRRLREQVKLRDAKRIARRRDTLFTSDALGFDPITGEPIDRSDDPIIDPLTGEPFVGWN